MEPLRVGATSRATCVAGAIAYAIRRNGRIELEAVGPRAAQQIVKAVSIARTYLTPDGMELALTPVPPSADVQQRAPAMRYIVESCASAADESRDAGGMELAVGG